MSSGPGSKWIFQTVGIINHCIQHSRFTKQDGWLLLDLSLCLDGNIAITCGNKKTHQTSIDVYSVRNSNSRDKPKILYSKEFEKYKLEDGRDCWGRRVSFVDSYGDNSGLVLATGLGDKLELFDLIQDRVLKSRKVTLVNHGWIDCLSVRERRVIFIGFYQSNKITVYDVIDLNEIKSIILQGIQDVEYPFDICPIASKLFAGINNNDTETDRSLIFEDKNGRILSELTKPTDRHWYVFSITVSVTLGVVAVVLGDWFWSNQVDRSQIIFYSLFSENISSFLIVEIESGVDRIRISDRGDRMVTRNYSTREVKVYDMAEFFTFHHLKTNLTSQLQTDDCVRLANFFALPKDQIDTIIKSDTPTENLLLALEEKGLLQPSNVDRLTEAFTELEINSSCYNLLAFYQKTRTSLFYKETIQKLQEGIRTVHDENRQKNESQEQSLQRELQGLKQQCEGLKQQCEGLKQQCEGLKQQWEGTEKLLQQTKDLHQKTVGARNTFKAERDQYQMQLSSLKEILESSKQAQRETEKVLFQTKELLEKAAQEKEALTAKHEESNLQASVKSMTLEEVSVGESLSKRAKTTPLEVKIGSYHSASSPTTEYLSESVIEYEFSKLLVKVSVKLTNDHCVMLATYFNFPESKINLIRKDNGTPGLTLLSVMKERNIINIYDITKLQKAMVDIELGGINETLLKPYQEKVDPSKYEQYKVPMQQGY